MSSVAQLEAEIATGRGVFKKNYKPFFFKMQNWKNYNMTGQYELVTPENFVWVPYGLHKVKPKLKEKTGVKISNLLNISASNWATELRKKPKESSWPTYMGRRPFPKLYLSQFSFKTGLRKTENWIKGYLIKFSIFVWFLITWASWKQNYQGKMFICLNIMWVANFW